MRQILIQIFRGTLFLLVVVLTNCSQKPLVKKPEVFKVKLKGKILSQGINCSIPGPEPKPLVKKQDLSERVQLAIQVDFDPLSCFWLHITESNSDFPALQKANKILLLTHGQIKYHLPDNGKIVALYLTIWEEKGVILTNLEIDEKTAELLGTSLEIELSK